MKFMEHKYRLSEKELVEGILNNNREIFGYIYQQNFERIRNMVLNFKNLSLDADDVFQEGLTRAVINIRQGRFAGESSFATYLYGICRNICLKDYQKNKNMYPAALMEMTEEQEDETYFENLNMVLAAKEKIDETCRKIIDYRFGIAEGAKQNGMMRFDAVAEKLGITADNARQRFGRCLKKLKKLLADLITLEHE